MKRGAGGIVVASVLAVIVSSAPPPARAAEPTGLPDYLYDRGDGISTSLFGTYVRPKELLAYTFYEYTHSSKFEYKPSDLGYTGDSDFFGKAYEHEFLIFLAYALNDRIAFEFESALYSTIDFRKASNDTSDVPRRIRESGVGDTEAQVRWRFLKESAMWPEGTFFFKTVFPLQEGRRLLGTQEWEFAPGLVVIKGFPFGTLGLRGSLAYDTGEHKLEFGEYAIDYVKRLSPKWRAVLSFEGQQDEAQIIGEVQYRLGQNVELKLNSGFGVTKKAPDFAPEIGLLFRF